MIKSRYGETSGVARQRDELSSLMLLRVSSFSLLRHVQKTTHPLNLRSPSFEESLWASARALIFTRLCALVSLSLRCHFRRRQDLRRPSVMRRRITSGERPTIARTPIVSAHRAQATRSIWRAGGRAALSGASSFEVLKRPSARRGPGIVSVDRNVRSKCRCSCVLQFTS